jgi:opacity protein-like surface antigen
MKPFLLFLLVLTVPAFAGTSAKQMIAPPPSPCLMNWFAGASVGYLTEFEEPMYNIHVGVTNSCWILGGWNVAVFAEIGYANTAWSYSYSGYNESLYRYDEDGKVDLTCVPVTANVKFERAISGNLNAYFGAGLGMAWMDIDENISTTIYIPGGGTYPDTTATPSSSLSESDWVLTTQVFAGLSYSVAPACEIYGGARWIYLSDANLSDTNIELDDDFLLELGVRYKF